MGNGCGSCASAAAGIGSSELSGTTSVMLCGVGGQGTILAADLMCRVSAVTGYDVKMSEIHGMAQRGGSVSTTVRYGAEVNSPIADPGTVDALVAFEAIEALRYLHFLKPGGALFVNDYRMDPLSVRTGAVEAPTEVREQLLAAGAVLIPATDLAVQSGSPRSANVVLMGALSSALSFPTETWLDVIHGRVPPHTRDANMVAFQAGRQSCFG